MPTQVFADLAGGFAAPLVLDHALSTEGRMKMSSTKNLFNMPKINGLQPYPEPPYYSKNREYFVIDYEADVDLLRKVVPEPLEVKSNTIKYEFIRMPSYGLGDFTESGQVTPVTYKGEAGSYIHTMVLDGPTSVAESIFTSPLATTASKSQALANA